MKSKVYFSKTITAEKVLDLTRKIVAENDVCYLVKAAPTDELDERILRTGDEVILAAAELHDGKVVK